MASGIRSFAAFWIGGLGSTGIPVPNPACPCPEWMSVPAATNGFGQVSEQSPNGFTQGATLPNNCTQGMTLSNNWAKRDCE